MREVAAASQEQSSGVTQISTAMGQVDQVTQRNASASEELASTAEEMSSQAEALQQLVSFFQLGGERAASPSRPAPAPAPFAHAAPHPAALPPRKGSNGAGAAHAGDFRRF